MKNFAKKDLPSKLVSTTKVEADTSQSIIVQAFSLVASCLELSSYQAAATGLATNLATKLECEQVSIGLAKNGRLNVRAMSHSARWDKRTNLIQRINAAMDESCDQETTIVFPVPAKDAKKKFSRAHKKLSELNNSSVLCTVPLANEGVITGAITLERLSSNRFAPSSIQLVELVATIAGPLLEMKRLEERFILNKLWDSFANTLGHVVGRGHIKTKLLVMSLMGLLIFSNFATGIHHVTADSVLEGRIQRTISAASDGYILSSFVRAGDLVKKDQVMAKLDDKDLKLQISKLSNQQKKLDHEYQDALVQHERVEISVLTIKIKQVETELKLFNEQLSRLEATAPFDGYVLEGDLTQALGMPIKRGDVMFKIAPLNDYRVMLNVDESDISFIQNKQTGKLTLTGLPNKKFPIVIEKITPVSIAKSGKNVFQVEATLKELDPQLRPNMKGVGKIEVGENKLLWIWTHKLVDWLVLKTWSMMP